MHRQDSAQPEVVYLGGDESMDLVVDLDRAKKPDNLAGTEWEYLHSAYGPLVTGEELWDEMVYKLGGGEYPDTHTVRTGSGGNGTGLRRTIPSRVRGVSAPSSLIRAHAKGFVRG
mgnify:CR=1 FL=1